MTTEPVHAGESVALDRKHFEQLFPALARREFEVIGPTLRDGAIVYDRLASLHDLPVGWADEQSPGRYRVKRRKDDALFAYTVGPLSWKKFLYPPVERLWRAERNGRGIQILPNPHSPPKLALFGVRPCELSALAIQDKVFLGGAYVDPGYKSRRESLFIVAVNCTQPGGTCFCASMDTGPRAVAGFDLAVTELAQDGHRSFLVESGTDAGAAVLSEIPHRPADDADKQLAERALAHAARHMGRKLDTRDLKELLYRNYEHPQWDKVAERCLSCANCTLVCPTCFCTTVEDTTDITGDHAERWRRWDSCFTVDFSYIHGGSVRATPRSRYRQWMVHKLAAWLDQFGVSGCVGCGRCITWCPVGIDIAAEVSAIRQSDQAKAPAEQGRDSE